MKKSLFVLLTAAVFIFYYAPVSFPRGEPVTVQETVPDADADYLISLRIFQGKGLYSSFSILYPPGRFIVQALLFKLFSPTFAINSIFHDLTAVVFFPAALFVFCYFFFLSIFDIHLNGVVKKISPILAYFTAISAIILNLLFFRYSQETHVIIAIFFIILLAAHKITKSVLLLLGILLGITFLFRIDAGIILSLSILIASFPRQLKQLQNKYTSRNFFLIGFLSVWIPILFWILFNGSLFNFLYDTLILGLIVQPKFMSLPIPENELKLVFLASLTFLTTSTIALFNDAKKLDHLSHRLGIKAFSICAVLSYISALGRSDEPHLWYGLVWVSPLLLYTLFRVFFAVIKRERFSLLTFVSMGIFCFFFSNLIIYFKSPALFIVLISLIFVVFQFKTSSVFATLIGGLVTTLLLFHSISYLKLKLSIPSLPARFLVSNELLTSNEDEVGGLRIATETRYVLDQIRRDIPQSEKYLFIFPNRVLWNEYFGLENPTRYIIISQERTSWTEREIIQQLQRTNTQYFLIYEEDAVLRKGPVWEWLLTNTYPIYSYQFGKEVAVLTRKKIQLPEKPIEYWLQF